MPFSAKQKSLLTLPPKDINIAWGTTGSGKSYIVNLRAYVDMLLTPPMSVGIVTGVSSDTIKSNVIEPLVKIDEGIGDLQISGSEIHLPKGRIIKCIGAFTENADKRIQGIPECHMMIIDEAPKLPRSFLEMAISRAKAPKGGEMVKTPVWMTGNAGHPANFIKTKYLDSPDLITVRKDVRESATVREWVFWPEDNPLNTPEFIAKSMAGATGIFLKRMYQNQWVSASGGYFDRSWCEVVDTVPTNRRIARGWDLASTEKTTENDPDYTASVRMSRDDKGVYYIEDYTKGQWSPGERDKVMVNTASQDGRLVMGGIEQDPGQAGKSQLHYLISMLSGYNYSAIPTSGRGGKDVRFSPFSSQAKIGNVKIMRGRWNDDFFNDLESFDGTGKTHDDGADATATAFYLLTEKRARVEAE